MTKNSDQIAHFHAYLLTEKRVSGNTFAAYSKDIEQFEQFLETNNLLFADIKKKQLNSYLKQLRDRGISAKTLSRKISSLKLLFNFLHERFNITNMGKVLIFPHLEKTLPNYLTEQEIQILLATANLDGSDKGIRNKVMLYLLYATGMRVSELVGAKIEQLHFDTGFIELEGKGNKQRMVPLPKNILELLRYYLDHIYPKLVTIDIQEKKQEKPAHKNDKEKTLALRSESMEWTSVSKGASSKPERARSRENYLFGAHYNGTIKALSRQSFWMILKKILTKAGITKNISPHSLRHSLATHLLKNGADIRSLQLLLGHENISTVQVYTHLEKSQVRKVYDEKHPRA